MWDQPFAHRLFALTGLLAVVAFILFKGIPEGPGFRAEVATLGFQAGFLAGVLIAAAWLRANNPHPGRPQVAYRELLEMVRTPIVHAVIGGLVLAFLVPFLAPRCGLALGTRGPPGEPGLFLVLGAHTGLYLGALSGSLRVVCRIRHRRESLASPTVCFT